MIPFSRYFVLLLLSLFVSFFSDCSNHAAVQPNTFGQLDSARIAADTSMQDNMDLSYEYQKTLILNDSVVYDFLAYDKPSNTDSKKWEGKFIVIKRTNTRQDTIIKDSRSGPVKGLCLADPDNDGKPEIIFYEDNTAQKYSWVVRIYSPIAEGRYREIRLTEFGVKPDPDHYRGGDTFLVYQSYLIRHYPYYEKAGDTVAKGSWWQSYKLSKGKPILNSEKREE